MSGEEKLTAWMFTAMSLDFKNGRAPTSNKGELLDRYNMLALPGTLIDKAEHRAIKNIRLLNYNQLKNIFIGNIQGEEAEQWIKVLEAARNGADKSAESFGLHLIDHVDLRMTTDTPTSV